jgi:4,4'-diaponeurosporenoate glycosyltransferase
LLLRGRQATRAAGEKTDAAALSIIVPARNESENLPRLLRSIRGQRIQPAQVIVVDDASTDRTADIAREFGATVISPPELPEGWRGKTWACQHGANAASGELLLFLDADTWFEENGLAEVLAMYDGGAFSVGPWHAVVRAHEQMSAYFNLVMNCAVVPNGLFGQMLLVEKDSYQHVGGHEAVKGRILENLALAGEFRRQGLAVRSFGGRGMLSFRMYPEGLRQLTDGWIKAFSSGAGETPIGVILAVILWLTGMMLAASLLPLGWVSAVVYLLFVVQLAPAFWRVGSFRWYLALIYPIPLIFFFCVFALSALRSKKPVLWKGRTIRAD